MSRSLFEHGVVNAATVKAIVQSEWDVQLGECIKASQNHTFKATGSADSNNDTLYMVRVTPYRSEEEVVRIRDEIHFVNYLRSHNLERVCCAVPTKNGEPFICRDGLIIVLFEHATGILVNVTDWSWMDDEVFAKSWGRWAGLFHNLSRQYTKDHPEHASRARPWDALHDGVMAGALVNPEDKALIDNPKYYGVLHGDINISNFFWNAPQSGEPFGTLHVFDWDQVQTGWFNYDLAMCLYFPYMLMGAGKFVDGSDAPSKERCERFMTWVTDGYDTAMEKDMLVDREALHRMVLLRRQFYDRFCRRAIKELDAEVNQEKVNEMAPMRTFMQWVVDWLDREEAAAIESQA